MKSSASQRHFFLPCDSATVTELTHATGKYVYSFGMVVDAIFGTNLISFALTKLLNLVNPLNFIIKALKRFGVMRYSFLPLFVNNNPFGPTGEMVWNEVLWDFGNLFMVLTSVFLTYSGLIVIPYIAVTVTSASLALYSSLANFVGVLYNHLSNVAAVGSA